MFCSLFVMCQLIPLFGHDQCTACNLDLCSEICDCADRINFPFLKKKERKDRHWALILYIKLKEKDANEIPNCWKRKKETWYLGLMLWNIFFWKYVKCLLIALSKNIYIDFNLEKIFKKKGKKKGRKNRLLDLYKLEKWNNKLSRKLI